MKKYNKYKKTNIDWIGEIPEHWDVKRLGYFLKEKSVKVSDKDYLPLSVTKKGVVPQLENAAKTKNHADRKLVEINDFVINARSDRRGSSGVSRLDGSVSVAYTILGSNNIVFMKYYHYLFRSVPFTDEFYRFGKGIVADLWSTRYSEMKNIYIPSFRKEEQKQIANYLDHKTALIDKLLESNEKKIKLLEEKLKATINQAVTKGLDQNVKMKESGVEWIGEIPEHWEVKKLKYVSSIGTGSTPPTSNSEYFENGDINWFTPSDYNGDSAILSESKRKISNLAVSERSIELLPPNTIFLVGIGATAGKVGISTQTAYCNQQLNYIEPKENPNYTFYLLSLSKYYLFKTANFATLPIINQSTLGSLKVSIPSNDEQLKIVAFVEEEINKYKMLKLKLTEQNKLLKEYRQSLISHVVTGKVDVRGVVLK